VPTALLSILAFFVGAIVFVIAVVAGWWIIVRVLRFIGTAVAHLARWIGGTVADTLRLVGAVIVGLVFVPLILANVIIGRWSAVSHYGRALTSEARTAAACVYRIAVGHPARLFGLDHALEGLERRLPNAIAEAPTSDKPNRASGLFEGYTIVGSLKGGGSGGKLYIAEPDDVKRAGFERRGYTDCDRVVIKTFSLTDGSSLPQIVRESRALDAARKMGLVLEHELTDERFFYVMKYVPGDSLATVTQQLHAESAPVPAGGLDDAKLRTGLGFVADLLENLDVYHSGGLWHKDVKPDNIIIDPRTDAADTRGGRGPGGRAHLVDFGLITPLRSAMTLTTHGTEYFRDPELVRMALRGVKVHQIDGARFDVYAAGAVLYSVIENQFPAHGGLSRVEKRCPEALRWVIRRAMTDYDKRYRTARAMLADLEVVLGADDPFAIKPAQLPSMKGVDAADDTPEAHDDDFAAVPLDPVEMPEPERQNPLRAAAAPPAFAAESPSPAARPKVANWWTGGVVREPGPQPAARHEPAVHPRRSPLVAAGDRAPAADQLRHARERVAAKRNAARARLAGRRPGRHAKPEERGLGAAIVAVFLATGVAIALGAIAMNHKDDRNDARRAEARAEDARVLALEHAEAELERLTEGDIAEQLAESERRIVEALAQADNAARSGLESALDAVRNALDAVGIEATRSADAPEAPDAPTPPGARPAPPAPRTTVHGAHERGGLGGPFATPGVRIAFLSDLGEPLEPHRRAEADHMIRLLEGVGAHVFGELTDPPTDPAEAGREITAIAELRHARDRRPLDAVDTAEAVRTAVARDDSLDGVLWIAPDSGHDDRVRLLIATERYSSLVAARELHPRLLARYALPSLN